MADMIFGAFKSLGEAETGLANRNVGNYNAQVNERNAIISDQQGDAQALQEGQRNEKRLGAMRANYGASGVTMDGSAGDVLEDSASQAKLNEQNVKYNAHLRSIGFSDNAVLDRYRAHYMLTASQYAASASLIQGGSRSYDKYNNSPGSGNTMPDSGDGSYGPTDNRDNSSDYNYGVE